MVTASHMGLMSPWKVANAAEDCCSECQCIDSVSVIFSMHWYNSCDVFHWVFYVARSFHSDTYVNWTWKLGWNIMLQYSYIIFLA